VDTLLDRENNPRALLLSGTGRYSDPQHNYAATSDELAGLLEEAGFDVVIASDVEAALAWLSSPWNWPDLLAVNVGLPRDGQPVPAQAAASGLRSWLGSGRPLLAIHTSATTFTDVSEWNDALGQGPACNEPGGLANTLRIVPDPEPAAEYPHPLGWTYERPGLCHRRPRRRGISTASVPRTVERGHLVAYRLAPACWRAHGVAPSQYFHPYQPSRDRSWWLNK
jgi:hypothetical protein